MKYYLGIDLGTSSIKVSVIDESCNIIASESDDYPLLLPKLNYSEQNPDDWFNGLINTLNRLNNKINLEDVASLSFSGQMHGLVILDENDKVIRPAILWNDSRTTCEVDYLNNEIGTKLLIEETGNIALCGFTAPKVLWLYNNERDNFNKISKIMLPKDYLAYKLSGVFASDVSDLSGTLFFDVKNGIYSKKMLDILHINESMLPNIYKSYEVIGNVLPSICELTGLSTNCKVVIGGGDQAIGATGTNTLLPGNISISLGTSGVVFAPTDRYFYDKDGRVHSFRHTTNDYHLMGCTLSAMGSLKWFLEDVLNTNEFNTELNNMPDDISELLFLPYLMGERSPINDPNAKGILANMSLYYKRSDIVKAVVEGICFSLYDVYKVMEEDGITATSARVIGGGTKNPKLMQILADIFGIPMKTINTSDGGALGAGILAMVADDKFKDIYEASRILVKDTYVYYPDLNKHSLYLNKFNEFKKLYYKNK